MIPEKQNDDSLAAPWLERRQQSARTSIDDTDYLIMLEEMRLSDRQSA